jgi:WD40 repeat protein
MTAAPQASTPRELLSLFSESVRAAAARLEDRSPVSVWPIVEDLLTKHEDYGGTQLLPLERDGPKRPLVEWLTLVAGLFDRPAVARTSSEVIDGRLLLLGLARIDDGLAELLTSSGLRWRLERDLRFSPEAVLVPWALPSPKTQVVDLWTRTHTGGQACAFSSDRRLLATAGRDGWLRIWEVASGELIHQLEVGDELTACEFSADSRFVAAGRPRPLARDNGWAAAGASAGVRIWRLDGLAELPGSPGFPATTEAYALSPDWRLLATAWVDGTRLHDLALGGDPIEVAAHVESPAYGCAFSPDGTLLASVGGDFRCILWDVASGTQRSVLKGGPGNRPRCLFSPDGRLLAALDEPGRLILWRMPDGETHAELQLESDVGNTVLSFSPDSRLLVVGRGRSVRTWDIAPMPPTRPPLPPVLERPPVSFYGGNPFLAFSRDGQLIAAEDDSGTTRLWDTASGAVRAELSPRGHRMLAFSPETGVFATISNAGEVKLWEAMAPPGLLPAVVSDATDGPDVVGVATDATALANLIAAAGTTPPLSIGLFGDWGSGKSFLIKQVQGRVRRLARRSQQVPGSAYCAYVRNVEFNAWHYADANLWASLVTHIFDELAKPEPAVGVTDERAAREQLARLEEELAAQSDLRSRLERAQVHAERTKARKQLLALTSGLAGLEGDISLATARERIVGGFSWLRLLVPTRRVGAVIAALAAAVGGVVAAVVWLVGLDTTYQSLFGVVAFVTGATGTARLMSARVSKLISTVGETAKVSEVRSETIDAELAAARARELELRQELADLATGRRLARFAAERSESDDYRAYLGLVWRIHRDFERMSRILAEQSLQLRTQRGGDTGSPPPTDTGGRAPGWLKRIWSRLARQPPITKGRPQSAADPSSTSSETGRSNLPRIDRIVLYIDDLDRCPPKRVVEVLEAVHLILALELFVVVLAVDPRWLLQSLELHYSQLLAGEEERPAAAGPTSTASGDTAPEDVDADEADETWLSTPLNYLEKIIQIPFALRPMSQAGGTALVHSLLPVALGDHRAAARPPTTTAGPARASEKRRGSETPRAARPVRRPAPAETHVAPSLSPRALALTPPERDYAGSIAPILRTPRAVKKFTNLYRLLRAGLDDARGELDRFLYDDGENIPEFAAVLILLAVLIRFPEQASPFLLGIGDLAPDAQPDRRSWVDYIEESGQPKALRDFVTAATNLAPNGDTSNGDTPTREPFRRWALEISRYSFATGQEVFASYHARAAL